MPNLSSKGAGEEGTADTAQPAADLPFDRPIGSEENVPPSHFVGIVLFDRCPISTAHQLYRGVSLWPLGPLSPQWLFDIFSRVLKTHIDAIPPIEQEYARAHPSAVLTIELHGVETIEKARVKLDQAWRIYYYLLVHWPSAPTEPFALGVIDRRDHSCLFEYYGGPHLSHFLYSESIEAFFSDLVPKVQEDRRIALYFDLFADFLREKKDSHAVVKGWTLLEIMSEAIPDESVADAKKDRKKARVRLLAEQLQMSASGSAPFLQQVYESRDEDVIDAAYRHRNCVVHEGSCQAFNKRCNSEFAESACKQAEYLRKDVQMFIHSLIRNSLWPHLLQ